MDPPDEGGFGGMKAVKKGGRFHGDGWQENGNNGDEQTLTFNNNQDDEMDNDLFT